MFSLQHILWLLLGLLAYTYIGYGMLAWLLAFCKKIFFIAPPENLDEQLLPITLIIPAYNEELSIEAKITNSLKLDYPKELLSIIIVADGSSDKTVHIAQQYQDIQVYYTPTRSGKMAALNRIMPLVQTPIVVFSDANTLINKTALREIVKHYANPTIGGVAGEKKILTQESAESVGEGEGLYWQYESAMKQIDSDLHTVVAAAGELFSIRTALYKPQPNDTLIDDLMLTIAVCNQGYTMIYEKSAFAVELPSTRLSDEAKRKIRIAAGAAQACKRIGLLPSYTNWMLNFQYFSRRILRWIISPLSLPTILIINLNLVFTETNFGWLHGLLVAQILFYILSLAGWLFYRMGRKPLLCFAPFYFVFMNLCMFIGFFKQMLIGQEVNWDKAQRSQIPQHMTNSTILQ